MLLCGLTDKYLHRICRSQYEHLVSAIGYWAEMCLDHVYIVLEPVGSARLTFDDDWYYEFMWFDVPKFVRSPGWDRDMTRFSKWSRRKDWYIGRLYSDIGKVPSDSGIFRSTRELREFVLGLNGPYGKGEKGLKGGRAPPLGLVRIGLGKGGAPFLPSLFPFLFSYSIWEVES